MFSKLSKIAKILSLWIIVASAANAQSAMQNLDGHWYSAEWKYGYVLKNGIGTATSTNSPNFQVGQNIIQLTSTSASTFSGQQVYTDGRFYNVNARLLSDGRLYFEGEKNVQWTMQRVGSTPQASSGSSTPTASVGAQSSVAAQSIEIWVEGGRMSGNTCINTFSATNTSNQLVTFVQKVNLYDRNRNLISSEDLFFENLRAGHTGSRNDYISNISCGEISSMVARNISLCAVNGEFTHGCPIRVSFPNKGVMRITR